MRRTEFLYGAAALALAACSSSGSSPVPSGLPWNQLAKKLSGRLVRPGERGFAALALPNNLRYDNAQPAGIALCQNSNDVSESILWARTNNVPLVARSGGHSYGGYSTTTGLMIDLTQMRSFEFDSSTGIATLGGGCRNIDLYKAGEKLGIAFTHGRCYRVGVAGLVLGGGIGFSMRSHGVTCDQLLGTEIVLADGSTQTLSATSGDADLLWACRGAGGGNFGINSSFTFQTFEVGKISAYDIQWQNAGEPLFTALVQTMETAPRGLGCKVTLAPPIASSQQGIQLQLLGEFNGTPSELLQLLAPVYAIAKPSKETIEHTGYWQGQRLLSEAGLPTCFHESSRFLNHHIGDVTIAGAFSWLRRFPGGVHGAAFKMFLTGGKINDVAPKATAFVHRSSIWLASVAIEWEPETPQHAVRRNLDWQGNFYAAVLPSSLGGAYQNFIDPTLSDWKNEYYGENLARLERIKKRVDPSHVFTYAEAIP